jgi:hypothetical protein
MLLTAQGSKEVTPSSNKEAPSDITVHCTQQGVKGCNKRHKQRRQGTMTTTSHDDGHDWGVGGSCVRCISTAVHSDKHPTRLLTDHFKKVLEEAYPNHAYPI